MVLIGQIEDLRLTVSRMEKEHNRREDMLRQEISDLQRVSYFHSYPHKKKRQNPLPKTRIKSFSLHVYDTCNAL